MKAFLQRGLLTAEGIEHFNAWKEDILRSIRPVLLTGTEHWVTVNRLIATRRDEEVYKTFKSFFPENHADLGALNPAVLHRSIEATLVTTDQVEFKWLRFELAKQASDENPWKDNISPSSSQWLVLTYPLPHGCCLSRPHN